MGVSESDPEVSDVEGGRAVGWRSVLEQVKQDTTARYGLYVITFVTALAIFTWIDYLVFDYAIAETLYYHPTRDPRTMQQLLPPAFLDGGTWAHPLGTDSRGRDILVRVLYGARISVTVGYMATGIGFVGGTVIGSVAGYYGGWKDDVLMRLVETLYAIPFLVLVITFMTTFGRSLEYAFIGVGIAFVPVFARLIRSRALSVREAAYVEAAQAAGVKDRNIILKHVIPNSIAPVMVQGTLMVGVSILTVAGLSFLGYGAQAPTPDWGLMLSGSRDYMLPQPWLSVWPGAAIFITVMGFNLLGDGLQDALDPQIED